MSFEVGSGEVFALVGESGAGKTLTARAVLGLAPRGAVVTGRVLLHGAPVAPGDLGRRLAWVPQDAMSALSPVHRVDTQLALAVRSVAPRPHRPGRHEARDVARRALAEVGLPEEAVSAYPHALSGGMRQRAVIAMALVNGARLVVADEPTTALDPARREQVLGLLRERCAAAGAGLLLVSHDLEAVRRHADRVAVLYAGGLVESGRAAPVLDRPLAPYTQGLVRALPTAALPHRSRLPVLVGHAPDPGAPGPAAAEPGCAFAPRCPRVASGCRDEAPSPRPVDGRLVACHHPVEAAA
ncbi:ABC transporter ATP-binding protein [Streptomyces sp. NPDC020807]|uniref:ABC transporter ATP-binding protein n=1 Tax=Streptomyces sp. NPDC020807 TaxID=3155119 RepID=UPI0033E90742